MTAVREPTSGEKVPSGQIAAVTIDLDDTLFDQRLWLDGAWQAVGAAGAVFGLDPEALTSRLRVIAAAGSDRGRIIDRALLDLGVPQWELPAVVPGLVAAFRSHAPASLPCYPGVGEALEAVRRWVPVGLITDGDPHVQRAKLRALGLRDAFDVIVFSDELGRRHRKPSPEPFLRALRELGVEPAHAVHIGDRPAKDVAGARGVGMRAIRVRTGEYRDHPDDPQAAPWRVFDRATEALHWLAVQLAATRPSRLLAD